MTGILCDRRAPVIINGMILKMVVMKAMMYGLEIAAVTERDRRCSKKQLKYEC